MITNTQGVEFVLCPKVATDGMLRCMDAWTDLVDGSCPEGLTAKEYRTRRLSEFRVAWDVAVENAPAFGEPSQEMVDRVRMAIMRATLESVGMTVTDEDWPEAYKEAMARPDQKGLKTLNMQTMAVIRAVLEG